MKIMLSVLTMLSIFSTTAMATTDFFQGQAELQVSQAATTLVINGDAAKVLANHVAAKPKNKAYSVTIACDTAADGSAICEINSPKNEL